MRRWLKRILIVLAVFVLPPAAFYFYTSWQADRELRAVLAELDGEETPWRWEDLIAARPKLDANEDVCALFWNTYKAAPRSFFGSWRMYEAALDLPPNGAIHPDNWETFNELMQKMGPALVEARKINQMAAGRFQIAWSADVHAANWNDLQKAREFITTLQPVASWHAQRPDFDAALDVCLSMQRACQSMQDEPTLMVHLIRMALQAVAVGTVQRVLAQGQPMPHGLLRLQRAWEDFDRERAMVNGLRGERAYCHRMFEAFAADKSSLNAHPGMRMGNGADLPFSERAHAFFYRGNLKQAHAWLLRHWTAQLKSLELPEPERVVRQRELDQEALNAPGAARLLMPAPAVPKVLESHRRIEAQIRCLITGLAAERFRREHDRWPKTLAELCPKFLTKVPDDPYSGLPLQCRVATDGIVIYAVGPDGKQCGMHQEDLAAKRMGSIPYEFRLWNVDQRRLVDVRQP